MKSLLLLALTFSTQVFADTTYFKVEISGSVNQSSVSSPLYRSENYTEYYQSTCFKNQIGPARISCQTRHRQSCISPSRRGYYGPPLPPVCRMETYQDCVPSQSVETIAYSCTKSRTSERSIYEGDYTLNTNLELVNPEALSGTSSCVLDARTNKDYATYSGLSCGNYALEIISKRNLTRSSRESTDQLVGKLVNKNDLFSAFSLNTIVDAQMDGSLLYFTVGEVKDLSQYELNVTVERDNLLLNKKLYDGVIPSQVISIQNLGNGTNVLSVNLARLNIEIDHKKTHIVKIELKSRIDTSRFIGIDSKELSIKKEIIVKKR